MDCGLGQHEYLFLLDGPASAESGPAGACVPRSLNSAHPTTFLPNLRLAVRGPRLTLERADRAYRLPGAESFSFRPAPSVSGTLKHVVQSAAGVRLPVLALRPRGSPLNTSKFAHKASAVRQSIRLNVGRIPAAVRLSAGVGACLFAASAMGLIPNVIWPKPAPTKRGAAVRPWTEVNASLQRRAAIDFKDDFRHGLEDWRSRSDAKARWSFDAIGFVHPGSLALYRPTLELTDYVLEFQAQVDRQGIGFVFRAADFDNYYAVKLVVAQSGPLPRVDVTRYSVIQGHEGRHTVHPLPLTVRSDTTYQVRMEVKGSDFTLITQGKVADHWSDSRLARGGIGFFCGKGDQARLRQVEVSHQNDAWGKLCARIAPFQRPNE